MPEVSLALSFFPGAIPSFAPVRTPIRVIQREALLFPVVPGNPLQARLTAVLAASAFPLRAFRFGLSAGSTVEVSVSIRITGIPFTRPSTLVPDNPFRAFLAVGHLIS